MLGIYEIYYYEMKQFAETRILISVENDDPIVPNIQMDPIGWNGLLLCWIP